MRRISILLISLLMASPALADRHPGSNGERTVTARVLKVEKGLLHVVLTDRGQGGQDVLVPTDEKTEILLDGQAAKLADLPADAIATITQVDGITTSVDCKRSPRRR
jgi:hypothetical protein